MRLSSLSLLSFAALSVFAVACAAPIEEPADEASSELVAPPREASRFVQRPGTSFGEIASLKLEHGGTYEAEVESRLVNPRQRCVTGPCTAREIGTFKVVRPADAAFFTLILEPKYNLGSNEARTYRATLRGDDLDLSRTVVGRDAGGYPTRFSIESKLTRAPADPPFVCQAIPSCAEGEEQIFRGTCETGDGCRAVTLCGRTILCAKK